LTLLKQPVRLSLDIQSAFEAVEVVNQKALVVG
jgi:hypothetical protein